MFHFVCKPADSNLDPASIAEEAFDTSLPYLVVLEKWTKAGAAPHWHFHGTRKKSLEKAKVLKNWLQTKNESHPKKKLPGQENCRPFASRKKRCDEMGFAYCLKQEDTVVVATNFSDEELDHWRERSIEYVQEKKDEMPSYVRERLPKRKMSPEDLHSEWRLLALEYYRENKQRPPPRNQANILWHMVESEETSIATKIYVSQRI